MFTHITLALLFIFLKAPLKAHPTASSALGKTNQKTHRASQAYKELLSALTTPHGHKIPAPTPENVFSTHAYSTGIKDLESSSILPTTNHTTKQPPPDVFPFPSTSKQRQLSKQMAFCPKLAPLNPTKMRLLCGPEPFADNLGPHDHPIHVLPD